jgi:vacuolar-type H+-ATPase subunit D/Vma8
MKATEILNNVKDLLNLSKEELKVEDIAVEESVELSTEEVTEEVKEEVEEVVLAEEPAEEVVIEEEAEAPSMSYATSDELSAVKAELLSMIKALIEDKPMGDVKDIPEELSKQEEVELSEDVEEVVHSPETKKNLLSNLNQPMTIEQRVNRMLFN